MTPLCQHCPLEVGHDGDCLPFPPTLERECDCGEPEVNKAGRCGFCQEQFESDEGTDWALDMAEVSR